MEYENQYAELGYLKHFVCCVPLKGRRVQSGATKLHTYRENM